MSASASVSVVITSKSTIFETSTWVFGLRSALSWKYDRTLIRNRFAFPT